MTRFRVVPPLSPGVLPDPGGTTANPSLGVAAREGCHRVVGEVLRGESRPAAPVSMALRRMHHPVRHQPWNLITPTQTSARVSHHPDRRMGPRPSHGRPVWRGRPAHSRPAPHVPSTIPDPRMGEAQFGGKDLQRCTRFTRSESDRRPTHGRSPVWRADPRRSYERSVARRTPRVAARLGWSFLITP
jgi:hypothetical protein